MFQLAKRLFDLTIALCLLGPTIAITAIVGVLVKLDSRGPVLFRQVRVGHRGKPFVCYKIRTMQEEAPQVATHEAPAQLVTRIGTVLRRLKVDELPQIWNVLVGEMSFVGPRPCLPLQAHLVELRLRNHILDIRPGITGLSQVCGVDMSDPEKLTKIDKEYLNSASFLLDLKIIWKTVTGKGLRDGVRAK